MKKSALFICCALLAAGAQQFSSGGFASAQEGVVAVVNGVTIPSARLLAYVGGREIPANEQQTVVDNIIISELIAQAAREKGLDQSDAVRQQLAVAEYSVLGQAYVSDFFNNNPVEEERIKARYEELAEQAEGKEEYNVAHILVQDEALAGDLLGQLESNPGVFAELAKEHSQDPGSAENGGVLGWVVPQALVPPFAGAMQALKDGEFTAAPVQTDFGWHIIRVDGRRPLTVPPLNDDLRLRIQQEESALLLNEHLQEMREGAEVKLN